MAIARPKSGVNEFTTTTGSGALTLTGSTPGFRGFVSADDGLSYPYAIYQEGVAFEVGIGTYTHASRQLARTTVLANINGTTVPLQLGAGTKEVSIVLPGERVAMLDAVNQFAADQVLNGNRLCLDEGDTWIDSATDDNIKVYVDNKQVLDWLSPNGLTAFYLMASNDTVGEGPFIILRRDSGSPAAFDALGALYWQGMDSSLTVQLAAKIRAYWSSVTTGAHTAALEISTASNSALQVIMTLISNSVKLASGVTLFTAGKTATSITTQGTELLPTGAAQIVCMDGNTPLHLGRPAGAGNWMVLYANGVAISTVFSNAAGDVSWQPFTGAHLGDFAPDVIISEHDHYGTVLASTGALLPTATNEPIYELRPAVAGDRRVLGVHGGRQPSSMVSGGERDLIALFALGNGWIKVTGPIMAGDLLRASSTPGVAEAQPDDIVRSTTVAKATNDSPDGGGERLVSCVYMAG